MTLHLLDGFYKLTSCWVRLGLWVWVSCLNKSKYCNIYKIIVAV